MGLGAVVQDHEGTILGWFGLLLPRDVAEDVLREGKKCINELESLTVALTVRLCAAILLQRHVVFYLDNEAARVTLLRMQSENAMLDAVAKISAVHESELSCIPWYARVPSRSNIADAPSLTHSALIADVRIIKHFHLPKAKMQQELQYSRHDLDYAYRQKDHRITQLKSKVELEINHSLHHGLPLTADHINHTLLREVSELFPTATSAHTNRGQTKSTVQGHLCCVERAVDPP